jgi:flagellar protein FlbT
MPLQLTLKPFERIVVNGCVMRNTGRRTTLVVETQADVVREHDMLSSKAAVTPVNMVYFFIQTALTRADQREKLVPEIQKQLAVLATTFSSENVHHVFEAANHVSQADYYRALCALRPLMEREAEILGVKSARSDRSPEPPQRDGNAADVSRVA